VLADANLAGSRRWYVDGFIDQGFRAPYLMHAYGLGHREFSLGILRSSESHRSWVVNSMAARTRPI
jgi:hypothetical protein